MLREISVVEQRYQAVLAVLEDGLSVTDAAEKVGVSRQTLHTWLSRYAQGGLEGLADRSHRPWSCPHQMGPAVEVALVELRQAHPGWGPDRLLYRLERQGADRLPSRAALGRALSRLGLTSPGRRRRSRTYTRWERGSPMELWQMDVMGGIPLVDGTEVKAVTGIDDHSRFVVAVGLVPRATSRPVCGVFASALATYGVPQQVLTDNGRSSPVGTPTARSRCCSTGSVGRTGSSTCSPRSAPRPRPARSSGSTARCAGSVWPGGCSTVSCRLRQ